MDISKLLASYIEEHHISIDEIHKKTNIAQEKLMTGGEELTAEEMLDLCFYLNIRPETMYQKNRKQYMKK